VTLTRLKGTGLSATYDPGTTLLARTRPEGQAAR